MTIINFEFKARTSRIAELEKHLLKLKPKFTGIDRQTDTYYEVPLGRLKLREGNIENALIFYKRPDTAGAKQSNVLLYKHQPDTALKKILTLAVGIKVVVKKTRKIYFLDNVKIHFDTVQNLGTFVEVEAIDDTGEKGIAELKNQCMYFADYFKIEPEDFISQSYSDLIMEKPSPDHY